MKLGFAILVSAVAAVSAQAQDARASRGSGPANVAAGGVDAGAPTSKDGAPDRAAGCSIVETCLGGGAPAVRAYRAPPLAPEPQGERENVWKRAPFVRSVARCGRLYIFQVWSESRDAWVIDRARLEGPKGQVLQVTALRFNEPGEGVDLNVIVAEAPPGMKLLTLELHLAGRDGRVAKAAARDLP